MKNSIFIIASIIASITIIACNNGKTIQTASTDSTDKTIVTTKNFQKPENPINELVNSYLLIKNSLVADDGKAAGSAAAALKAAFEKTDKSSMTDKQKLAYADIADDAKEMSEHIRLNPDKLDHQREHFEMLSQDMVDLVKIFGTTQTLYLQKCPMYNKGAAWLSETKKIKNPFMGLEMSSCGSLKEEFKP